MKKSAFLTIISLTVSLFIVQTCVAKSVQRCNTHLAQGTQCTQFLFALIAKNATIQPAHRKNNIYRLTLHQVANLYTYFSDRPARISGSHKIENLIKHWNSGKNSFEKVPPNAEIETLDTNNQIHHFTVELYHPVWQPQNHTLLFTIKPVGKTQIPAHTLSLHDTAIFIDDYNISRWG